MASVGNIAKAGVDDDTLRLRAEHRTTRLTFPPSYVLVGIYRLVTDRSLYVPMWDKCKHGLQRGGIVSLIWAGLTYKLQKAFIEYFLINSPRVTGLSQDSLFGYKLPIAITTYASILFLSSQIEFIVKFFLSKNIRIARERAWELTVKSRGKGPEFWQPYFEEWQQPPAVVPGGWNLNNWIRSWATRLLVQRVILMPLNFYPFVGIAIGAWFKGVQTARYLHKPYFASKKMDDREIAVFMEERKWDYRAFGFMAALVEGIPLLGLLFTVSNRIGAAMWAHDLEKRQHMFRSGELKPLPPREIALPGGEEITIRPEGTGYASDVKMMRNHTVTESRDLSGSWEELTTSHLGPQ